MSSCKRRFSRSAISRLRPASVSSSLLASSWWRRLIISRSFAAIVSFWRLVHMHKFGNIFTITHGILISSDSYNEVAIFKYVYCANWHIPVFFLSFFLSLRGVTCPSRTSAEACLMGWPNARPQGWDKCSVARHHQVAWRCALNVDAARPLSFDTERGVYRGWGNEGGNWRGFVPRHLTCLAL